MIEKPPAWMDRANCIGTDPDAFFPNVPGESRREAVLKVCRRCEVARECLFYALDRPQLQGIWGATSERRREEIRQQLAEKKEKAA